MDYLDIVEVDSVEAAVNWLRDDDPCVGQVIALNLTKGLSSKDLREAADSLDAVCCWYEDGVFRIDGDLWFVGCDFGH